MKKQQKIIELRTAAKRKVAELETKIAFAHSEAKEKRANLMIERSSELHGLRADGTERFDVLANYRAKLAVVDARLTTEVAQLKFEIYQTNSECEQMCAAAEDDPESETEQQQTVYCDGSEHSARIAARRLINKLPHIPEGGAISVMISRGSDELKNEWWIHFTCLDGSNTVEGATSEIFNSNSHNAETEAAFVDKACALFAAARKEGGNE